MSATDSKSTQFTPGRSRWRLFALVLACALVILAVKALVVQAFVVPTESMQPTLAPGDRVLVWRPAALLGDVRRGEVVVFDGTDYFAAPAAPPSNPVAAAGNAVAAAFGVSVGRSDFVKRVIGLGGDRVICCDAQGRLTVNGTALSEPYLSAGMAASRSKFDITVPAGRMWLMGDNRDNSQDSRAHLGDPGGGMVPVSRVVGQVVAVWWPWERTGLVSSQSVEEASS